MSEDDLYYQCSICGAEVDERQEVCHKCQEKQCKDCGYWSVQGCMLPERCEYYER